MEKNNEFRDVLKVKGVKAKGFGIIPKMVMLDRKLTIEAKAIYSYFCSYAGAGTTAFPSRDKICKDLGIGKDRYYKHFKLLKEYGYILVEQEKADKNKFSHNIYTLVENPVETPSPENKDTEKKPSPQNKDTENEDTENKDTNNNKSFDKNNNPSYNNQSVSQEDGQMDSIEKIHSDLKKIYGEDIFETALEKTYGRSIGKKGYRKYLEKICKEQKEILDATPSSRKKNGFNDFSGQRTDGYTNGELEKLLRHK